MGQIIAIAWLRYRLLANGFRRERGLGALISAVVLIALGTMFSLGMAFAFGAMAYAGESASGRDLFRLALLLTFWAAFLLGLVMLLGMSAGTQGLDTSSLVSYPLGRRKLFAISVGSAFLSPDHLLYYPALLATFFGGMILTGEHVVASGVFFLLVPVIVVVWAFGVAAAMQGILRRRRGREMLGFIGFGILVLLGIVPAFFSDFEEPEGNDWDFLVSLLEPMEGVARFLPPHLATDGITAVRAEGFVAALPHVALLIGWALAGVLLAYGAFTAIALKPRIGSGSKRVNEESAPSRWPDITALLPFVPVETLAVAAKEFRYMLRSPIGRFNLVMIPLFAALVAFVFAPKLEQPILGVPAQDVAMYGLVLYTVVFTNNSVNNSLGWEGAGFQAYFLSPVRLERVILGKNLGIWMYDALLITICLGTWAVLAGFPGFVPLLCAVLVFISAAIGFTGIGNFVSIAFPVARDIASMKNSPSQAAILLSLVTIAGLGLVNFFFLTLPVLLGVPGGPLSFLVALIVICVVAYRLSLRPAARFLAERKEEIITILEGRTGG